jgi:hypothetical protein
MFTCAQPQARPTQQISFSLRLTGESSGVSHHLNSLHRGDQYIISSPSQRERHTQLMGFPPHRGTQHSISVSERNHTPNSWASSPHTGAHNIPSPSQRGTHPSHGHTQLMGFLTPHRGTQRSISVSERNHTPISWAHPTHGLPHRPTHSVCVLEDVSRSCNHQHSLSAREAFSIRPSLSRKYSNFVLAVIINTPSQLGRYSSPGQVSHGSTQTSSWQAVW